MISGITHGNDRAQARILGVRDALAAQGMELAPDRLIETPYGLEAGRDAARRLLALHPRPTAIICGNDVLAAGALAAARAAGLSVPRDLSVTGFDNIELSAVVSPPLTTVNVPHRRMGKTAAGMLLRAAQGEMPASRIAYRTEIVRRESLGPAPAPADTASGTGTTAG
jgi:LacI family transcriptional regulator